MSYQILDIFVESLHAERLCDVLLDFGALSTAIEDEFAETDQEEPIFDEPQADWQTEDFLKDQKKLSAEKLWKNCKINAIFDQTVDIQKILSKLVAEFEQELSQLRYEIAHLDEQDWVRLTQSQFDPIHISDRLWIVPSWHESPNPNAINLILDPGLAFGTGSHPTTKLCLTWIDQYFNQLSYNENNKKIDLLDYGCGSGILAIASLKLAQAYAIDLSAVGVDIDPQAVIASEQNAEVNAVNESVKFFLPNKKLELSQTADILVANILTNPICALAPLLISTLKPNGKMILSGILKRQEERVKEVYQSFGMNLELFKEEDGWICLYGEV